MDNRKHKFSKEKIFSCIISLVVVLALGYGVYSVVNTSKKSEENNNIVNLNDMDNDNVALRTEDATDPLPGDIEGKQTEEDTHAEAANADASSKKKLETVENAVDNGQQESTPAIADVAADSAVANNAADIAAGYTFSESDNLLWPVAGDVILKYSMDSTIYFPTLGAYKCNPAISIGAEEGTNVGVAASGVVQAVNVNEETGTTVDIAIGNGYVTTYGMLKDVVVKSNDTVVQGQLLGKVASPTAYYSKEGANLYFKLTKDGQPVDPTEYFGE